MCFSLTNEIGQHYKMNVTNIPQVFEGFTPRVVLEKLEDATILKSLKKVTNNTNIPYI